MLNTNSIIIEVSYRRSTKDSYSNFIFNYHDDDVEGSAPLLNEEGNHHLESTKLSPILPEVKSKFESQHNKSNVQVFSHENNVKKSIENHLESTSCKTTCEGGNDATDEDILIDLQEVTKPTSRKKKNKKNQKVPSNDSEVGKDPPPHAGKKKLEPAATAGGSLLVQVDEEEEEDSTVVSFLEDSHLSQDWL